MKVGTALLVFLGIQMAFSQDSVDVYFTYKPLSSPSSVYLPGEFNNWANNSQGVIYPNPQWSMTKDPVSGTWYKWVRLKVGGGSTSRIAGAYQYKFNENGCSTCWLSDPLNQRVNLSDAGNSYLFVKDPTIFHFIPNQRNPIVNTSVPTISAYIFPKVGSVVDTSSLSLTVDGTRYTHLGSMYNFTTLQFIYTPTLPLPNGTHTVILNAGANADTAAFTTHGGFVQILNEFPFTTWKDSWTLNGTVSDSSLTTARIVRNSVDTFDVSVSNTTFSQSLPLIEGANKFVAIADSSGNLKVSSAIALTRKVSHSPVGVVSFRADSTSVTFQANGSYDPDSTQTASLAYQWFVDSTNPLPLQGLNGANGISVTVPRPVLKGEYYFSLVTTDPDGNRDTTRDYFTVHSGDSLEFPTIAGNPAWAQQARVYFLFPKGFTQVGTLNTAAQRLQDIHDLGFNVVWLTPVMKNAYPIDNNYGIGYNITDFYNLAPEYGSNQDLRNFVVQAHSLGIKVILDITPNHTSRFHPWSADAHTYKTNSPYWNWYQHQFISHNDNGLGQSSDADNFWYYSGFSDQLLNLNWTDLDLRMEMINVLKYWIQACGVDGYRFDVYWGPHRRYGEQYMGKPVRDALKHVKPDILLLGEDDGTGPGTETIYADYSSGGINGGVDAAYDFKLYFNQIENFGFSSDAITSLHGEIYNGGYYPGRNSLYMRFMESQDEDRIVYQYSGNFSIDAATTFMRTMPMASVIFTAPGFPMLWNGQEVGWGYGINGSKEARSRSVINWNYQGKFLLAPHYQKLANIRGQFPAFTHHKQDTNHDGTVNASDASDFVRVSSTNGLMYAFCRPYADQNGLTVVNFSGSTQSTALNLLSGAALDFAAGVQPDSSYYLNDLYGNTRQKVSGSQLSSLAVNLPAYGTAIYTISTTPDSVIIANPILDVKMEQGIPSHFALLQNYPNPFNPVTTIAYDVPKTSNVVVKIFDVLGREITTLVNGERTPGHYAAIWNANSMASGVSAKGGCASGVYFYQLTADNVRIMRKMVLLR